MPVEVSQNEKKKKTVNTKTDTTKPNRLWQRKKESKFFFAIRDY